MKTWKIDVDGREVEVSAAQSKGGVIWIHFDGEVYTYEPARMGSRGSRTSKAGGNPAEVTAPMPGKIVKILVQEKESVKTGRVLVVMEAMKMEYTLKAPTDAVVEKIEVTAGDQVVLGQVLVRFPKA